MEVTRQLSKQWFNWVHSKNLIYNCCWEDPRIDRTAMELTPFDNVLMITSAGCNALDYALDAPQKIYAVDVNPKQTALLDLKIAAIKNLEFDDFFQLFGKGHHPHIEMLYKYQLRKHLPWESREIWDERWRYFDSNRFRSGFYYRGSAGLFAWMMNRYMDFKNIRNLVFEIFETKNFSEQVELYKKIDRQLWSPAFEYMLNTDVTMSLLGVPRAQRKCLEQKYHGNISLFIKECLENVFTCIPLFDNYFWWLYLSGEYSFNRCPEYLKEENFQKLKNGLVDCIETQTRSVSDFLEKSPTPISHYVLLDHMDWLADSNPAELQREWNAIALTAVDEAKILFRSGGTEIDFLDPIEVPTPTGSAPLSEMLNYNHKLANELHAKDRVQTYGCFKIANWSLA